MQRIVGEGQHAASWIEATGPQGQQPGLSFFEFADDGRIARITDFWPDPTSSRYPRSPGRTLLSATG